ncbi:glycosyltransferase family 2 protein [uncultured Bacteroides sp.]|uniref:glycosyltransferase family 2 protein n=1 Tax=uncultured Bacteroides sp. TaxID=162156 RepID=UPI0025FE9573|nr:glycosyltransferase family 2 protein [uncultured Bacteroides sp.]
MSHIEFSIIIPHKNTPDLLLRCVDSIPNRDDLEVIIVDDCSDKIVRDTLNNYCWKNKNVKVIGLVESKGGGFARNIGITHVKGKWVLFADSDDYYSGSFGAFLDNYLKTQCDVIYFKATTVEEDLSPSSKIVQMNVFIDKYLKNKSSIMDVKYGAWEPWNKMIKYDLIKNNNISFDEVSAQNDAIFSLKIGMYAKSQLVTDWLLYYYVQRKGSIIHSDTKEKIFSRLSVSIRQNILYREIGYKRKIFMPYYFLKYWKFVDKNIFYVYFDYLRKYKVNPFEGFFNYFLYKVFCKIR